MKTQILGTGLSGLVGSRIVELLTEFDFCDLSFETGVDITNREQVFEKIRASEADWILHMAAKTDVDGCENDKSLKENSAAWKINVVGTGNICEAAHKSGKKVLFISTDFVFDGSQDNYSEGDLPKPINWYGKTKFEAEKIVLTSNENLVVRIAYPFRAKCVNKKDFVHQIWQKLKQNKEIQVLTDHIFTPTYIDDIALALKTLISKNISGVFHVVGSQKLTPYHAAQLITKLMHLNENLLRPTTISQYYRNRAKRPYKLYLRNVKITSLDVPMRTFSDGLKEIITQGVE